MDPLTQTLLGAVAAQAVLTRRLGRAAALLGAAGGAVPDADVLLGALADPALPFEWHRHFTHALVFIPAAGLIAAAPLLLFRRIRRNAGAALAAATIGAATHGLLDNCTTYGTHLLWPFGQERTSWDVMSIVDPIFTAVLLLGVIAAWRVRRVRPALCALVLGLAYIGAGAVQHGRAAAAQRRLADARGHEIERARVMPGLGNIILWRSIYLADGRLHADLLRVGPGGVLVREGGSAPRFDAGDLPEGAPDRARAVLRRLDAFATGFVAAVPRDDPGHVTVGDMRISTGAGFEPIWGVRLALEPGAAPAAAWTMFDRDLAAALAASAAALLDPGPAFGPLPEPPR